MDGHCSETTEQSENSANMSILQAKKEINSLPLASLELLNKYGSGLKLFNREKLAEQSHCAPRSEKCSLIFSIMDIIKVARARFHQYTPAAGFDDLSALHNAYHGLSREEEEGVGLVLLLLESAEKLFNQQFDSARKLIRMCSLMSSPTGNPIQRVGYYFSEALCARIGREMGNFPTERNKRKQMDVEEDLMSTHLAVLACQRDVPFCQIHHFTGIQAILESVGSSTRVHLVDLGIKSGMQWTILMQALADRSGCHLEILKITAVGTSKQRIEETGKSLSSFAENMNLPFSFKVVVEDLKDLKEDHFELEIGEVVAVYSELRLSTMLVQIDHLVALMSVITNLHPSIMVVTEVQANTNSKSFMARFDEALPFWCAIFDCLHTCMQNGNQNWMILESAYLRNVIQNMITAEGKERIHRHGKIDYWRAFFSRFGMEEMELSNSSLCQANLLVKKSDCWSPCTVEMNGKSLILGWKGTPIHSVSAWKFIYD